MLQFPPWKVILILITITIGGFLALPNMLNEGQRESLPGFVPREPVNLGLDLQGGVYLLLEVDHQRSLIKQLDDLRRETRNQLNSRRGADRINYTEMRVNPTAIEIRLGGQGELDAAISAIRPITHTPNGDSKGVRVTRGAEGVLRVSFTNDKLTEIQQNTGATFAEEFTLIEAQIRQVLAASDAVNVSGIEVIEPSFSFRPRNPGQLDDAAEFVRDLNASFGGPLGSGAGLTVSTTDTGEVQARFTNQRANEIRREAVTQTISKLRPRLDPNGLGEMTIQPQGEDRIILEAPGEADPRRLKALIQQPGELTFNLVDANNARTSQAFSTGRVQDGFLLVNTAEGGQLLLEEDPIIEGDQVQRANQCFDQDGFVAVCFTLTPEGGAAFGRASGANVGRRFAIVLDGESQSAPVIRTAIVGGSGIIEGQFQMEEARDLATIIQAGALPADIIVREERTTGPSLGQDSIEAGTTASIIGLVLVAIFMVIAYGLFGIFAVSSLFVNIVLILGVLSLFGATLTLPGIAGIILTIGMAVDANVLVFERIREEARNGRSPMSAVDTGYQQALSTIMDANITTLLAAAVLYTLGSGPVKGFAVTLAIGIFTSVFTAFVVTRWFTVMWLKSRRPKDLPV